MKAIRLDRPTSRLLARRCRQLHVDYLDATCEEVDELDAESGDPTGISYAHVIVSSRVVLTITMRYGRQYRLDVHDPVFYTN